MPTCQSTSSSPIPASQTVPPSPAPIHHASLHNQTMPHAHHLFHFFLGQPKNQAHPIKLLNSHDPKYRCPANKKNTILSKNKQFAPSDPDRVPPTLPIQARSRASYPTSHIASQHSTAPQLLVAHLNCSNGLLSSPLAAEFLVSFLLSVARRNSGSPSPVGGCIRKAYLIR